MVTLKQVAKHAGVSPATVSRVLNKSNKVDPVTRQRVEHVLQALGYQLSRVARRLRVESGDSNIIGLIIPDIQNPFFSDIARGVEDVAQAHNYAVILANSDENAAKEKFSLAVMRAESVDGIILPPIEENDEGVIKLVEEGIPFVCVDRIPSNANVDTVSVDNRTGTYEATELLIKRGHRRIGFIAGLPNISTSRERRLGFEQAHAAYDIPLPEQLVGVGDSKQASGMALTNELLSLPEPPTAIVVGNNLMTLGALMAIHQRGLRIPEEIAIIGFDDFLGAECLSSPLTVVRQPSYDVGREAFQMLLERIQQPDGPPRHLVLRPTLIIRHSSGAELKPGGNR